ncbi:hypothetical protein, partial [Streptomyces cyaneofuscatus]|uniref:hypothetical protein n=1 Tax=Streptomyces cyaneofuscatus TaxID=66883 RepID=UPI003690E1F8
MQSADERREGLLRLLPRRVDDDVLPVPGLVALRSSRPSTPRTPGQEALADYDQHGDALFSLALLLYRDADLAADAVVSTLTRASATATGRGPDVRRRHLAADLLTTRGVRPGPKFRRGEPTAHLHSPDIPPALADETRQGLALLGSVMFGGHSCGQAAALLSRPASSAAVQLRTLLCRPPAKPFSATLRPVPDRIVGHSLGRPRPTIGAGDVVAPSG